MIEVRRYPGIGGMTDQAVLRGHHMVRVFARGDGTVMTTATGTDHISMINSGDRNPCGIAMTILTHICGLNMSHVLTRRAGAVMAAHTVAGDIGVIERSRHPGVGCVAVGTDIATGDMICTLTRSHDAIVTAGTGTLYLAMVDLGSRYPGGISMAILTQIRGQYV